MMRKFLTAKWRDLIMVNYEVDPLMLADRIPSGTRLDLNDDKCFISLVGFMFRDTRVLGFLIPFHVNFEEVNLRFYVTRDAGNEVRRGVVFIKEIVPGFAIAAVARTLYGEPYERWLMNHIRTETQIQYTWERNSCKNSLGVSVGESLGVPASGSHGEFIIEHYWGYTKRGNDRTDEYKVEHPKWELFSVENPRIEVDFSRTYGDKFAFLNEQRPFSVLLAKGSEISVYKGSPIRH